MNLDDIELLICWAGATAGEGPYFPFGMALCTIDYLAKVVAKEQEKRGGSGNIPAGGHGQGRSGQHEGSGPQDRGSQGGGSSQGGSSQGGGSQGGGSQGGGSQGGGSTTRGHPLP